MVRKYAWILIAIPLIYIGLLTFSSASNAQIIILPDCNVHPEDPFCQGQCRFVIPKPTWCPSPPTPTPTPSPEPIVLVPGFLASFNVKTIFRDQPSDSWSFVPLFGNVYRGLIERLEKDGYKEGENLFIAYYDWRNPVSATTYDYLKPVIEKAKQKTGANKVNIIAHSMGGLLARNYVDDAAYSNDIDQLILIGTPNEGAADAYLAWEGGELPDRWGVGVKGYINLINLSLRHVRNQKIDPPLAYRSFFPSIKDLLPIAPFVKVANDLVPIANLTEQNTFLQDLQNDTDLIEQKGVHITTIAGTNLDTLGEITINDSKNSEDEANSRWRDGHPNPDPPLTNTNTGDQTVLLTSAHLGENNVTLSNVPHDKLPEEAQEEVLSTLGLDTGSPHIAYETPSSMLGFSILSPLTPSITCSGKTLSKDQNDFGDDLAQYVADPDQPDNYPKLLVIGNPPTGDCEVDLTGTGTGEYHVITTYADADETRSSVRQGTTTLGQHESFAISLTGESIVLPPEDLEATTQQLQQAIFNLFMEQAIKPGGFGDLYGDATSLHAHAVSYVQLSQTFGSTSHQATQQFQLMQRTTTKLKNSFNRQMNKGTVTDEAIRQISGYLQQLQDAGL